MLRVNDRLRNTSNEETYKLLARLGEGAFGQVWRVSGNKDPNRIFVVKFFYDSPSGPAEEMAKVDYAIARWVKEVELRDSTLVPTRETSLFPYDLITVQATTGGMSGKTLHGLKFFDTGGMDLFEYREKVLEVELNNGREESRLFVNKQNLKIATLLCKGLAILHKIGIIHGDIKLENVIVVLDKSNGVHRVYFIDFGLACAPRAREILVRMGIEMEKVTCPGRKNPSTGEFQYSYTSTPDYVDPASRNTDGSVKYFSEAEHLTLFEKFDLYSLGRAIAVLWYSERFGRVSFPDLSPLIPKYADREPVISPKNTVERIILQESGIVALLLFKLVGPIDERYPAHVLEAMFEKVYRFAEEEEADFLIEKKKKAKMNRSVVTSSNTYEQVKEAMATLGNGLETRESTIPGAGLGLFATRDFADGEVITSYYGQIISYKEARTRPHSHIRSLYTMRTAIDGRFMRDGTPITDPATQLQGLGAASLCNDTRTGNDNALFVVMHSAENLQKFESFQKNGNWKLDPEQSDVFIFADGPISEGQEIFVSYGKDYWKRQ